MEQVPASKGPVRNFLTEVLIGDPDGKTARVYPSLPNEVTPVGAISVIAGRNNTGKSHILHATSQAIDIFNRHLTDPAFRRDNGAAKHNIWIKLQHNNNRASDHLLFANNPKNTITPRLSQIPYQMGRARPESLVRQAAYRFIYEHIAPLVSDPCTYSEFIDSSADARALMTNKLDSGTAYPVNPEVCAFSALMERLLGATLFAAFEKSSFSLYLGYGPRNMLAFPSWSDGQKILFSLILMATFSDTKIFLIDELENHLHPAYITDVLSFLKTSGAQIVIATHHPHILFSQEVDSVWFVEREAGLSMPRSAVKLPDRNNTQPSFSRTATQLSEDFEKLSGTYKLFSEIDNLLLRLSETALQNSHSRIARALLRVTGPEVKDRSGGVSPDAQSRGVIEDIERLLQASGGQGIKILDFGAGIGRTYQELAKLHGHRRLKCSWILWEPDRRRREELGAKLGEEPEVTIPAQLSEIEDGSCDAVLVVNVLHELTPIAFAEVLLNAMRVLSPSGKLLVCELYPLIFPEKFAVSYAPTDIQDVLLELGVPSVTSTENNTTRLLTAYSLSIGKVDLPPKASIELAVRTLWSRIKTRCLGEYSATDPDHEHRTERMVHCLTQIASIEAAEKGLWR